MLSPNDAAANAKVGEAIAKAAAKMSPEAGKALEKFFVELTKLDETAGELQGEVDSLKGAAERLSGNPNFGDGGIASVTSIHPRHQQVAKDMQKLLKQIRGGIAHGQDALLKVAQRYAAADERGKEEMDRIGTRAIKDDDFSDRHKDRSGR
ncbi:MAG: hypothetical protein GEV03_26430 [Streptosporangiales bacterium]|nr:hypothetical protein [Streptosporangiales bacterium]